MRENSNHRRQTIRPLYAKAFLVFVWCLLGLVALPACGPGQPDVPLETHDRSPDSPSLETMASSERPSERDSATNSAWALIACDEAEKTGFAALAFSELSRIGRVDLLEREAVASIDEELKLAAIVSGNSVGERLALGQRLAADRLLVVVPDELPEQQSDKAPTARAVILDTRCGAKLDETRISLKPETLEEQAQYLARWTQLIERRYRDGVQTLVAVPYFVNQSLDRRFDSLQQDYTRILCHALMLVPGVALVSIEESVLIAKETNLDGAPMTPIARLCITGEYKVDPDLLESSPNLSLKVAISDGNDTLAVVERADFPMSAVPQLLAGEVAEKVLKLAGREETSPIGVGQIEKELVSAADRLVRMGCFSESSALRETVVAINPDNVDERIKCLNDYWSGGGRDAEYVCARFDYLLRNRLINYRQAMGFMNTTSSMKYPSSDEAEARGVPEEFTNYAAFHRHYHSLLWQLPAPTCEAETIFAANPQGDRTPFTEEQLLWQENVICSKISNYCMDRIYYHDPLRRYPADVADGICDFFRQVPMRYIPWYKVDHLRRPAENWRPEGKKILLDRLKNAGDPRLTLLASYLALGMKVMGCPEEVVEADRDEIHKIGEALKTLGAYKNVTVFPMAVERFSKQLDLLAAEIEKALAVPSSDYPRIANPISLPPEQVEAAASDLAIEIIEDWAYPAESRTVHCRPDRLFAGYRRQTERPRVRLVKHSDSVDIAWDEQSVYVLTTTAGAKPFFHRIYTARIGPREQTSDLILKVKSDGRFVWIATLQNGILVMTPEGKQVACFDESLGLPAYAVRLDELIHRASDVAAENYPAGQYWRPSDGIMSWGSDWHELAVQWCSPIPSPGDVFESSYASVTLLPVDPGRCLGIGRTGATRRLWIALLEVPPVNDEPHVEVIHSATRLLPLDKYQDAEFLAAAEQNDVVFNVPWACLYQTPKDEDDRVYILGRWHDGHQRTSVYNSPLAVDLRTWEVSTLAERLPQFGKVTGGAAAECLAGTLVVVHENRLLAYTDHGDGTCERHLLSVDEPTQNAYLLRHRDFLISPGNKWYRIDADLNNGVSAREIAGATMPPSYEINGYSESANYGLFAANYEGDFAFRIVPDAQTSQSLSPFARYVPGSKLAAHDRAVAAIRRLGGDVDRTGRCLQFEFQDRERQKKMPEAIQRKNNIRPPHQTIVCLPDTWKGGDEGLRHLLDLHALSAVYILDAPVSDEGMKYVAQLDDLREFYLVGTQVTDAGLAEIASKPMLRQLHLENGNDLLLGDDALEHLAADSQLEYLALHGSKFTEASVPRLKTLSKLKTLRLLETNVPFQSHDALTEPLRYRRGGGLKIFDSRVAGASHRGTDATKKDAFHEPVDEPFVMLGGRAERQPNVIVERSPFLLELYRQAVLIAARDELGICTRDYWLGETLPAKRGLHIELECPCVDIAGNREFKFFYDGPDDETADEMFELNVDRSRPGTDDREYWSRRPMIAILEQESRGRFSEILMKIMDVEVKPNRWVAQGAVPSEIERLLKEPTFAPQFLAVRKLHQLIRENGESPQRLAALVWGYVHLGYLTECNMHPMHEVFKVRAILYAARLEAKQKSANASYAKGILPVTLALTGFHRFVAEREAELPEFTSRVLPPWLLLGRPCLTFNLEDLEKLAEHPDLKTWATLFYLSHLSFSGNERETLKLQRVLVQQYPECYRIWNTPAYTWGVTSRMQSRDELATRLGATIYERLHQIAELPESLHPIVQNGLNYTGVSWISTEHKIRGELTTRLADPEMGIADQSEMSWQVLGSLIREVSFTQAAFRAYWLKDVGAPASALDRYIDTSGASLRTHRFWDLLDAYHSARGASALERVVADSHVLFKRLYRVTGFDLLLCGGFDYEKWRPHSPAFSSRLRLQYAMPNVRNQFYANVREALRQPLTDENNKTGVVDRISVSPSNPWLVQYRIEHEWDSISRDQVDEWWDKYQAFPEVRRSIALQYARSGQNAEAIKRISSILDSTDEPDCALFLSLGDAHMAEGNIDGFVDAYRQFLEHPGRRNIGDIAWAGYLGGLTVLGTERQDLADFFLERAADTPTDQGRLALAILRELQGRTEEADEILRKRIDGRPNAALDYYWFCLRVQPGRLDDASAIVREAFQPVQPVLRDNRFGSTGTTYNLWASITGDVERSELVGRLTRRHADPFQRLHGMLLEMEGQRESAPQLPPRFAPCPTRFLTGSRPCLEILLRKFSEASMGNTSISDDEIERIVEEAPSWETANVLYFVAKYLELCGEEERAFHYWRRTVKLPVIRKTNRNLAVYELRKRGMTDEEYRELIRVGQ